MLRTESSRLEVRTCILVNFKINFSLTLLFVYVKIRVCKYHDKFKNIKDIRYFDIYPIIYIYIQNFENSHFINDYK